MAGSISRAWRLAVATVGLTLFASAPAVASSPVGVDEATRIALWEDVGGFVQAHGLRGLAGGSLAPDGRTVEVYWAGEVPAALSARVADSSGPGLVVFKPAAFDRERFGEVARDLSAAAKERGIPVTSLAPTLDFMGVRAWVDPSATDEQRQELRRLGVGEVDEEEAPVPLSRSNDSTPYWGGAVITAPSTGQYCSTGFIVRNASGVRSMVTAQHCGSNLTWKTPGGATVGTSNGGNADSDVMLISGGSYSSTGYIYSGAWNSSSAQPVHGVGNALLNESVCAGGGMSGEVCGAKVSQVNVYVPGTNYYPAYAAMMTDQVTPLAGVGDSGGPGYRRDSGGNIILLGMIDSGFEQFTSTCPGGSSNPWNQTVPMRSCFYKIYFMNQYEIMQRLSYYYGITAVVTG